MTTLNENLSQIIATSLAETLENMAFIEALRPEAPSQEEFGNEVIWSKLETKAPHQGYISFVVSPSLATELTDTLYSGAVDSNDEWIIRDALSEILNTIAGRLMAYLTPSDQSYRLGLPSSGRDAPNFPAGSQIEHFVIGDKPCAIVMEGTPLIQAQRPQ